MGNRRRILAIIVAIAILSALAGWFAAQRIKNPDEVAAETAAPPPSLITAPVESRALSRDVVTRVDASYSDTSDISLTQDVGANVLPIVTGRIPEKDALLNEGDIILEIAERPFFVLGGELPIFRSLRPGDEGIDVQQLEEALLDLGFFEAIPDTNFGPDTETAIEAMYANSGYTAPGASETQEEQLDLAKDAARLANDQVIAAQEAVDDALQGEPQSSRLSREQQWADAQRAITAAEAAHLRWQDTNPAVTATTATRDGAIEALNAAQTAYNDAVAGNTSAATPPAPTEPTIDPETGLPIEGADPAPTPAPVDTTALWQAVIDAQTDLNEAEADLALALSDGASEAKINLDRARESYAISEAIYRESLAAATPDASEAQKGLDRARETLTEAQDDLARIETSTGTWLPDYEFMFLANLPRRINRVLIDRGGMVRPGVPVIQATGAELRVTGGLPEANRKLVNPGDRIVIENEDVGLQLVGTLSELADVAGSNTNYPDRFFFRVEFEGDVDVEQLISLGNVKAVIPIERTEGEVLAVPLAALSAGADGSARVEVLRGDEVELVTVTAGLESGGFVEVTGASAPLDVNDQVVVGFENSFADRDDEDEDEGG